MKRVRRTSTETAEYEWFVDVPDDISTNAEAVWDYCNDKELLHFDSGCTGITERTSEVEDVDESNPVDQ